MHWLVADRVEKLESVGEDKEGGREEGRSLGGRLRWKGGEASGFGVELVGDSAKK